MDVPASQFKIASEQERTLYFFELHRQAVVGRIRQNEEEYPAKVVLVNVEKCQVLIETAGVDVITPPFLFEATLNSAPLVIQFDEVRKVEHKGHWYFYSKTPENLWKIQKRNTFRVELTEEDNIKLWVEGAEEWPYFIFTVADISHGGFGASITMMVPLELREDAYVKQYFPMKPICKGDVLEGAELRFPDRCIKADLVVRIVRLKEVDEIETEFLLGLEFIKYYDESDEHYISRFIVNKERDLLEMTNVMRG